jgi:bacteriocin-like protein
MRRKHMADEKEVKKPGEISKETRGITDELSENDLEKISGGTGGAGECYCLPSTMKKP